jgi:glycosyltransferase involved in cell wall biosynthesis
MSNASGLHVLILPSWYPTDREPVNGVFFREQAEALQEHAGVRVGVAAPVLRGIRTLGEGGVLGYRFGLEERTEGGVATLRGCGWSIPRAPAANRRLWLWMARRLAHRYAARHGRPQLIHAHSALSAGWPAREIAREWGIPYVVTEHTSLYAEGRIAAEQVPVIRGAFGGAARVVAVSRALARDLAPYAAGTPVEVIPNGTDPAFFTLPPAPRGGEEPFRFLHVGLSDPVKGVDVLLRAFAEAFHGSPEVTLDLGGGGPLEGEHRRLAEALEISDRVRFVGRLTREQVREAMWRADAFVLPSHVETFGVVLIEAMATGLPVVATACGGPQDTIVPGTGTLVPPGESSPMAEALRGIVATREEWRRAAPSIRAHVVESFSSANVATRLAALYRRVLSEAL